MNRTVKGILATVIAVALGLVVLATVASHNVPIGVVLFWTVVCVTSEFFWVRTLSGDSVHSLAATVKLSALVLLGPAPAIPTIFVSTLAGNMLIRRTAWYKALYNASQLTVAGATAAVAFHFLAGVPVQGFGRGWTLSGSPEVLGLLGSRLFLLALLSGGVAYILVNNTLMAWLMTAVTGRKMSLLWKENCLYPEEIQSSAALVLMAPLLILLYAVLGPLGLLILFGCLGLVRAANELYVKLVRTQDGMVRGERMAAMGELAEEIGVTLGDYLKDLKELSASFSGRAADSGNEKARQSATIVEQNVNRMAGLVEGLAAFSHRETQPEPTEMNRLIQGTIEFVRPQNRFDAVTFDFRPDPSLPVVTVDPGQMQQVLLNLFANAADALNETGQKDRVIRVVTEHDERAREIRLRVSDNGPGIPKASLPRIFEPHFTTKATGHGFGLSTVFRIAENHRGHISAQNLPEGGAQFLLELPAA